MFEIPKLCVESITKRLKKAVVLDIIAEKMQNQCRTVQNHHISLQKIHVQTVKIREFCIVLRFFCNDTAMFCILLHSICNISSIFDSLLPLVRDIMARRSAPGTFSRYGAGSAICILFAEPLQNQCRTRARLKLALAWRPSELETNISPLVRKYPAT